VLQALIATVLLVELLPLWSFLRNHETHLVEYPDESFSAYAAAGNSFDEQHVLTFLTNYPDIFYLLHRKIPCAAH
jgi:hypothetical protein